MENSFLKIFANYYASDRCYGGSDVEESARNAAYLGLIPVGKIPWRREWLPTPAFLPGEF